MNLLSAVDPVQGIMRGMAASGRAADSDLTPEQRKAALIEAGVETASPLMMMGLGALAKQPVKATLMDVLAPTGATKDIAEDVLADPSRRNFLAGAAATVPVAALAPDVITDVVTKAAKTGSRAAPINPINMAVENILLAKKEIEDIRILRDETIDQVGDGKEIDSLNNDIYYNQSSIYDEVQGVLNDMEPSDFKTASNEALEEIAAYQYDYDVEGGNFFNIDFEKSPNLKFLVDEAKRRNLNTFKNEKGITQFPNLRQLIEDYEIELEPSLLNVNPSMQMVRETPPDLVEEMRQMRIRSADRIYKDKVDELRKFTDFAEEKIQDIAERARQEELQRKAMGGPVEGIASLSDTARDMYRGPRGIGAYQQFTEGGAATSSDFLNALMEQSAQAKAKREEENKAIALAEQRQKFADEEKVMSQPLDNSLASTYARAAKMGEDEFMVGVAPKNINPMYQLAMKGDPRGIFGVLPLRDETKTYNIPNLGSIELAGYDSRSMKDVVAGIQKPLIGQAIPDFKDREELRGMIPFFAKDLTDEEKQQLKRPVLADPMMANKVILAHEAGHLYDDEFFVKNMDVVYPLYEELLDGYGMEYGDGFVGEYLQELFEPVEFNEKFTEMGVTDEMRQAAQDYLRRGVLDTDVLSPATIGVLSRLKRLMNEDSKLTTALRPRPRPSQLN